MASGIDLKQSTASPVATDIGNKEVQARVVSKTIQLTLFTTNRNAVWGGRQDLLKESYPLANISFPANRNVFRLEVGDPFLFSCVKYGVTDMVCRVAKISEEGPESENITVQAIQDYYSIANAITQYVRPTNYTQQPVDYTEVPLVNQRVVEAPYVLTNLIGAMAFASRETDLELGFNLYMSVDDGASYSFVQGLDNLVPYGTLNVACYAHDFTIDPNGIVVDFEEDEEDVITSTWASVLAGTTNLALLGDEIISFVGVTPITTTQLQLENVIRGRYGTEKQDHAPGTKLYVITEALDVVTDAEVLAGAVRKFKLVPFNSNMSGDIADATAIDLTVSGLCLTPYKPINFAANGSSFAARYDDDIVLTWSPRYRGKGAGIGIPGTVLAEADREGLFTVEVWVGGSLVRTTTAIDAATWTYTEAMNLADNVTLASLVTFKLANYRTESGYTYTSEQVEVVCKKNP